MVSQKDLSQKYAQAVYALALEGWQKNLTAVQEKLAPSSALLAQLNNTQTSFAERRKILDGLLPADLSDHERNFFYTLLQNGDLSLLGDVATNLTRLATKGPGVGLATVTTAIALSEAEQAQFQAKLSAKHGDNIEVDFVVDEAILGGVIVQVGDQIMDGSVASKLNTAQERLSTV